MPTFQGEFSKYPRVTAEEATGSGQGKDRRMDGPVLTNCLSEDMISECLHDVDRGSTRDQMPPLNSF